MATSNHIDPAIIAKQGMDSAGNDDAAYDVAREALHSVVATTREGVNAQLAMLFSYFNGDTLLPAGRAAVRQLIGSIDRSPASGFLHRPA